VEEPGRRGSEQQGADGQAGAVLSGPPDEHDAAEGGEGGGDRDVAVADGVGRTSLQRPAGRAGEVAVHTERRHHAQREKSEAGEIGPVAAQGEPAEPAADGPAGAPCR
jgi:hypothetical protein